jgi:hypothetical protein
MQLALYPACRGLFLDLGSFGHHGTIRDWKDLAWLTQGAKGRRISCGGLVSTSRSDHHACDKIKGDIRRQKPLNYRESLTSRLDQLVAVLRFQLLSGEGQKSNLNVGRRATSASGLYFC